MTVTEALQRRISVRAFQGKPARLRQLARNFEFFGAPLALLAAERGLGSCFQV